MHGEAPAPDAATTIGEALLIHVLTGAAKRRLTTELLLVHDDAAGRLGHHRQNYDFFGAPVGIILTVSRRPLQSAPIVCGLPLGYADRAHRLNCQHTRRGPAGSLATFYDGRDPGQ